MNAYSGDESYVFISYAHEDRAEAEKIIIALKRSMCRVWYDEGLTAGGYWNDDLAMHILNSACVLVLLSGNSVQSHYVRSELNFAISHEKDLIPIYLENCALPFGLELMIGHLQISDLYEETNEEKRVKALELLLPPSVFAAKKAPFYENGKYSFFLEKYKTPNPDPQCDTAADDFSITCKYEEGNEAKALKLFDLHAIPAYEIDYTVTQCKTVNDDYFVGEIHGITIFNVLAKCQLNYPLSGPDFDVLLIFALRIPADDTPSITLIDYQNMHIVASDELKGRPISKSPWACVFEGECKRKLYRQDL